MQDYTCAIKLITTTIIVLLYITKINGVEVLCLANPHELTMFPTHHNVYQGAIEFRTTEVHIHDDLDTIFQTRGHRDEYFKDYLPDQLSSPTIRLKRGNKYEITLKNLLPPTPDCGTVDCEENTIQRPNTSNLHTHGLHVSGAIHGDDVKHPVEGGEEHTYTWNIPCDHPGGTSWYHPHHHGNSVLQVGGGAAGVVIVDDDILQDGLPSWWDNKTIFDDDQILIFAFISFKNMEKLGSASTPPDDIFKILSFKGSATDALPPPKGPKEAWLVNGNYKPTICLTSGKWRKFRMAHVDTKIAHNFIVRPQQGVTGSCEMKLVAKDGITVNPAPRNIPNEFYFGISSRVDVVIHCTPGIYEIAIKNSADYVALIESKHSTTGTSSDTLEVVVTAPTLEPFSPIRPSFLEDTFDSDISGPIPVIGGSSTSMMGIKWNPDNPPLIVIDVDTVQEWDIQDTQYHPFHLHVHHMQLQQDAVTSGIEGWSLKGDWVDLIDQNSRVRFRVNRFGGPVMMHCHVLEHEDEGAMGMALVRGGCDALYNDINDGSGLGCDTTCPNLISTPSTTTTASPTGTGTTATSTTSEPTTTSISSSAQSFTQNPVTLILEKPSIASGSIVDDDDDSIGDDTKETWKDNISPLKIGGFVSIGLAMTVAGVAFVILLFVRNSNISTVVASTANTSS